MKADDAYILAKKYTDKTIAGAGGLKGDDGFSPTIVENPDNTDTVYKLNITDVNGTITTPNLKADESNIPTKTSELTNDSGFITESQLKTEETTRANADTELQTQIDGKADVSHTHLSVDITDKDTTPTSGSAKLVTSGGVYTALNDVQTKITKEETARAKADAPLREFMESTANYTDTVNLTKITSTTEIATSRYNVGDILYIQNTDTSNIDYLASNIDLDWDFSETIVSGQTYKVQITKIPVGGADMEQGIITVLDNITLRYELNNVQPKLHDNATNFLLLINQEGATDFYFDASLDFGYPPTVDGAELAINHMCSGTEYDTRKIWIDGQEIYRKDFAYIIATDNAVIDWSNNTIDLIDICNELFTENNTIKYQFNMFGAYSSNNETVKFDLPIAMQLVAGNLKFDPLNSIVKDDYNYFAFTGYVEYVKNNIKISKFTSVN